MQIGLISLSRACRRYSKSSETERNPTLDQAQECAKNPVIEFEYSISVGTGKKKVYKRIGRRHRRFDVAAGESVRCLVGKTCFAEYNNTPAELIRKHLKCVFFRQSKFF